MRSIFVPVLGLGLGALLTGCGANPGISSGTFNPTQSLAGSGVNRLPVMSLEPVE